MSYRDDAEFQLPPEVRPLTDQVLQFGAVLGRRSSAKWRHLPTQRE